MMAVAVTNFEGLNSLGTNSAIIYDHTPFIHFFDALQKKLFRTGFPNEILE